MTIPQDLQRKLNNCTSLITLPAIALEVIDMAENPDVGLVEIERVIRNDPALSAKLVRVANSPLFARTKNIESILQALTLLGLDSAISLTLSFSLIGALKSNDTGIDSQIFWRRCIVSAITARELGAEIPLHNLGALFLAGLLQDLGMLALYQIEPQRYQQVLDDSTNHSSLIENETSCFGCDHAAIGAFLVESWRLPPLLADTVNNSHCINKPEQGNEIEQFQNCIALSGPITDFWIDDNQADCENIAEAAKNLGLSDQQFEAVIDKVLQELPELSSLFEIELIDSSEIEAIQQKSKEALMIRELHSNMKQSQQNEQVERIERRSRNLEEVARRDGLTGLYNRSHLDEVLKMEFDSARKHGTPLSITFIDIDLFKPINDSHGHQVGDKVIKILAQHMEQQKRSTDIVARYGGDEFMLVMPGCDSSEASIVAQRILDRLRTAPIDLDDGLHLTVSASIGISTQGIDYNYPRVEYLIKAADVALYNAKQQGRDRVCIYSNQRNDTVNKPTAN